MNPTINRMLQVLTIGMLLCVAASGQQPLADASVEPEQRGVPVGKRLVGGDMLIPDRGGVEEAGWKPDFWVGNVVPFAFDPQLTAYEQVQAMKAMNLWEGVTAVDFVPHTNQDDWVTFTRNDATLPNASKADLGKQGGEQFIYIGNNHWTNEYVIAHEVAHSLGRIHEQQRPDASHYIEVNTYNIIEGEVDLFTSFASYNDWGPYDFDSLMHYDQYAVSKCSDIDVLNGLCPVALTTIDVLPPNQDLQDKIGQVDHLSVLDKLVTSFLYPEPNWVFLDTTYQATALFQGGFFAPYDNLPEAWNMVPDGGTIWILDGDTLSWKGTFDKPLTMRVALDGDTFTLK